MIDEIETRWRRRGPLKTRIKEKVDTYVYFKQSKIDYENIQTLSFSLTVKVS